MYQSVDIFPGIFTLALNGTEASDSSSGGFIPE
jgi:hypothetical protein